jgi:hypothetical protein
VFFQSILAFLVAIPDRIFPNEVEAGYYPDFLLFDESVYQDVMKATGEYDNLKNRQIKCRACGVTITQDSLRAVMPNNGTYDFVCDDPLCYHNYFVEIGG